MKIGFIGLGLMGNPMAKNIKKKGFDLAVYNRTPKKTEEFKKLGVPVFATPKQLARNSDVIITIVTGPKDVEEVLFDKNGVVEGAKKGCIVIDMSTIGPEAAKKVAERLSKHKIEFLDAPVTGSVVRAQSGELTIFIGGKKAVFEKVKPVLGAMGTHLCYIGPTGDGQAMKLVNNLLVGTTLVALSEGFLLADAQGLDRKKVVEFLSDVPAVSAFMKLKMPNMVKGEYKTAFSISNMYKDLALALKEVQKEGKDLPTLKLAAKLYKKAIDEGLGDEDNSAVMKVLEQKTKGKGKKN